MQGPPLFPLPSDHLFFLFSFLPCLLTPLHLHASPSIVIILTHLICSLFACAFVSCAYTFNLDKCFYVINSLYFFSTQLYALKIYSYLWVQIQSFFFFLNCCTVLHSVMSHILLPIPFNDEHLDCIRVTSKNNTGMNIHI